MTATAGNASNDSHILLTGATGRLGRALLSRLTSVGSVRALVVPEDPGRKGLAADYGIDLHVGDLANPNDLERPCRGVDTIIHAGARLPGPGVSEADLFDSILRGTFHLLEATAQSAAPQCRFIYVSTTAVYGPQLPPDSLPLQESHPLRPTSVYGAAKLGGEVFVEAHSRRFGIRSTIVRPSDIVTSPDFEVGSGFMCRRFDIDLERRQIGVKVDRDGQRRTYSFTSAADIADGIFATLGNENAIGQVLHLGPSRSANDLAVAAAIARKNDLEVVDRPVVDSGWDWTIDSGRARDLIGFVGKDGHDVLAEVKEETRHAR